MRLTAAVITITTGLVVSGNCLPAIPQTVLNANNVDVSDYLQSSLTTDGLLRHTQTLQKIADDHNGTRVFGSDGHISTVSYISRFTITSGYDTWIQPPIRKKISLKLLSSTPSTPLRGVVGVLSYAGLGCDTADYDSAQDKIVLVKRGSCTFGQKSYAAAKVGARALIVYNNEDGPLSGTLGHDFTDAVPTGAITRDEGHHLRTLLRQTEVTMRVAIVEKHEQRQTYNVIAETKGGNKSNVVVLGAHTDSVFQGPGINDNGSGTAALLELSHLFRNAMPNNAVRFCWFTGEESGLLGSKYYVSQLSQDERDKIALYLNFDMIASPNYYNGIYDGDGSDSPISGPPGSAAIERLFQDYFESQGAGHDPAEFDGRSDYGPFINVGIPSGGLFTGAEDIKTRAQAKKYGGQAGVAYDACYHQACDTIDNLNTEAFLLHSRAIAHAISTFSQSTHLIDDQRLERKVWDPTSARQAWSIKARKDNAVA
ncbi:Leucyl aminopeptidase yscIV [Apophysomyces sp. BC1034]|nr:Leucyl aminopeptidase yscIV [Apophysomyces sp. BC1015]KAG0183420.1 Leucyl aminopeptidase yscIV [Apophysomyces sp. BC1021]KAG0193788.1 Leucyl aminopeptidase yscIV [Apophysomyces sp. BC1034]